MKSKQVHQLRRFLILALLTLVGINGIGWQPNRVTAAGQNPSLADINLKIEQVAREKGIPGILLKAIAFRESRWRQWDAQGQPVLSAGQTPAIGLMQINSKYIEAPDGLSQDETIRLLKEDIDFNLNYGADLLNQKWAMTPQIGDGDRNVLENWYFALWAYHTWTETNNPNCVPAESPRTVYQDEIIDLCAHPKEFFGDYIQPVHITRFDPALLPVQGVPKTDTLWLTPQPAHAGDLSTSLPLDPADTPLPVIQKPRITRIAGTDRLDTAIRLAQAGWPLGAPAVVLARADDFPDALAGVPLAAQLNAPILLTPSGELDTRVAAEIERIRPDTVYLLGGTGVLKDTVSQALSRLGWGMERQIRLAGADRYATVATIIEEMNRLSGDQPALIFGGTLAVASGEDFPDVLSLAALAGERGMPIVLSARNQLPEAAKQTLRSLKPERIYVIGGQTAVSEGVLQEIQSELSMDISRITRIAGADRYATSAALWQALGADKPRLLFATGDDFPDALAGAAFAVQTGASLILVPPDVQTPAPEFLALMARYRAGLESVTLLGGERVLSDRWLQEWIAE
ncbi:MAG: cell wall-binding repeat-containing protein [Peptococcaceae bacterium]|jgi:putative cell wall-binding protein|nr:cell wall-binding repeat-containing protein [Peptococcaceae bacterium]